MLVKPGALPIRFQRAQGCNILSQTDHGSNSMSVVLLLLTFWSHVCSAYLIIKERFLYDFQI